MQDILVLYYSHRGSVRALAERIARGIESVPGRPADGRCAFLPLHELCLFKLGMPFGELWYLHPLAQWLQAHGRYRFMLTAPALRLPGAVGSPVTPVATV